MLDNPTDLGLETRQIVVKIFDDEQLVFSTDLSVPLELGRQSAGEPQPYCRIKTTTGARVVIARLRETTISRRHVHMQRQPSGRIRIVNRSKAALIEVDSIGLLQAGESCDVETPALLSLGTRVIRLVPEQVDKTPQFHELAQAALPPGRDRENLTLFADLVSNQSSEVLPETMIGWLRSVMDMFQSAANSADFLSKAARSLVDIVNLDSAAVLRYVDDKWQVEHLHFRLGNALQDEWRPSRTILEQVRRQKHTSLEIPENNLRASHSLAGVSALVAAPILDQRGEVIGALYGDRQSVGSRGGLPKISELEAMLVDLLASGVAAGLARLEQEQVAMAARVQFEQFFTPQLARKLESEPDMLEGKEAEVSVLFCDLRGFSRITERIGPARAIAWVRDVLGALSDCVIDHQGVVVDYIGDEVMAMWGAPELQPNQAQLAARAALQMIGKLPALNQRWEAEIGEPVALGIGLHTGMAMVGNTGTHVKFKYGALGNTVNLASRVQGATKHVNSPLLITGATAEQLDAKFHTRRLCQVRVVNIAEPVTLYELAFAAPPAWLQLKQQYEEALATFEDGRFLAATRISARLLDECPEDGPTRALLLRAVSALSEASAEFDPVWKLPSK